MKKILLFLSLAVLGVFIPLIISDRACAMSAEVNMPDGNTSVMAGDRLNFNLDVKYPENPARKDLILNYIVKKDDVTIVQTKVLKAIETQSSFADYVVIPPDVKSGLYTLEIKITDYDKLSEDVSASFVVVEKSNQIGIYLAIVVGAICILGVIVTVEIKNLKKSLMKAGK